MLDALAPASPETRADRIRRLVDEDPALTPAELDQLAGILGLVVAASAVAA